jgi:hypothetical protein
LWQTDASGRFLFAPDGLDELVGVDSANLAGRRWDELVGVIVHDPDGEVSGAFANRETWSSQSVLWRIGQTDRALPVDFAGIPIIGRDRQLKGFRGFGLARTGDATRWPSPAIVTAEATADEPETGTVPAEEDEPGRDGAGVSPAPEAEPVEGDPIEPGPSRAAAPLVIESEAIGGPAPESAEQSHPNLSRLTSAERSAFREIARALGARFDDEATTPGDAASFEGPRALANVMALRPAPAVELDTVRVLDRLPLGILIHAATRRSSPTRVCSISPTTAMSSISGSTAGVGRLFRGPAAMRARAEDGRLGLDADEPAQRKRAGRGAPDHGRVGRPARRA